MPRFHSTTVVHPAIVLAVGASADPDSRQRRELCALLHGLGYTVTAEVCQRRHEPSAALPIGSGKLEQLQRLIQAQIDEFGDTPLVAAATDLKSGHLRNLERATDAPVVDRSEVILRIFEARAESPLAKLEIERARLVHSLPRIRDLDAARRQEGGGGRAAKGHSSTELAKRAAEKRIADLARAIAVLREQQERRSARRQGTARVALVGYTNVGKSSLMERLTRREAGVKDELFHTLATRVHALRGAGQRILVADTIGFLDGLPHTLLESFHSTLAEALDADLLLHVADASSPKLADDLALTTAVLRQIGRSEVVELLVLNKIDLVSSERRQELLQLHPEAVLLSAHSEDDARALAQRVRRHFTPS